MNADLQIGFRRLGIRKDDCIRPNWGCYKSPWVWVFFCFLFYFWPYCSSCGVLVPWRGTELGTMAVEGLSTSHWTTRELSKSKMFWHLVDNSLPWIPARLWRHTDIRPSFLLQSRTSKHPPPPMTLKEPLPKPPTLCTGWVQVTPQAKLRYCTYPQRDHSWPSAPIPNLCDDPSHSFPPQAFKILCNNVSLQSFVYRLALSHCEGLCLFQPLK